MTISYEKNLSRSKCSSNTKQQLVLCRCFYALKNITYPGTPLLRLRPTAEVLPIKEGCVY